MSDEDSKIKTVAAEAIGFIEGMAAAGHFGSGPNPDFIRMCKILDDWRAVLNRGDGVEKQSGKYHHCSKCLYACYLPSDPSEGVCGRNDCGLTEVKDEGEHEAKT